MSCYKVRFHQKWTWNRRKKEDRIFGCDLSEHLLKTGNEIPLVLKCCAEIIEKNGIVDGIYRLSGVTSNIQKLRRAFYEGRLPSPSDATVFQDIHCVASLLKMYFRELPNPLLTYELYDQFVKAVQGNKASSEDNKEQQPLQQQQQQQQQYSKSSCESNPGPDSAKLERIRDVIRLLPHTHYRTLEYLLKHLSKVSSYGAETGMTPKNVAIVWAPNLLRCKDIESHGSIAALRVIGIQAVLTEYLIRFVDYFFDSDSQPVVTKSVVPRPLSMPPLSAARLVSLEEARVKRGLLSECDRKLLNGTNKEVNKVNFKYTISQIFHF